MDTRRNSQSSNSGGAGPNSRRLGQYDDGDHRGVGYEDYAESVNSYPGERYTGPEHSNRTATY